MPKDLKLYSPVSPGTDPRVAEFDCYSSVYIGDEAKGSIKFFTYPIGTEIQRLGALSVPVQDRHDTNTTNMIRAAEIGQDFSCRRISFVFSRGGLRSSDIDELDHKCYWRFRVAGREQAVGPFRLLLRDDTGYSHSFEKRPVLIAMYDTVEVVFGVASGAVLSLPDVLVRCVLSGFAREELR